MPYRIKSNSSHFLKSSSSSFHQTTLRKHMISTLLLQSNTAAFKGAGTLAAWRKCRLQKSCCFLRKEKGKLPLNPNRMRQHQIILQFRNCTQARGIRSTSSCAQSSQTDSLPTHRLRVSSVLHALIQPSVSKCLTCCNYTFQVQKAMSITCCTPKRGDQLNLCHHSSYSECC